MTSNLMPIASLRVSKHQIPAHNLIPNTSIQNKPLMHYHGVFPPTIGASAIESHLGSLGVVSPQWRYTMYSTTHFHSTSHEVLCISRGKATLCFGGEDNPGKVELEAQRGDMLIVPAGVGHRLLRQAEGSDGGFEMVGSYPPGYNWDMCYGQRGEESQVKSIENLPWFTRDPVYGDRGPALDL
ncbi:hypothetical protein PFICI_07054 [Pestalotiopsis fici W106-1]|uniref:Uncharacterized protein n=1 Tax=Pestalotiopsis fici (strain W106-1 / CGMCC3.15140) TaxID=1229662 RepID=W3X9G8_PESFW|nr:uncharacterized protein PFICI_07054 [Pestalotiopsis fici W106-1]ETS82052.1 hypothetical protein PFICI_07054 [Pestalotiopsis fici W106-1]